MARTTQIRHFVTARSSRLCWGTMALAVCLVGCRTASPDPAAPSGGQDYVLDYAVFATAVDSILTEKGCDNVSCHGGGIRGTFELSPNTDKDIDLDYEQASLQVNASDPEASPLLVKPLAESAGGVAHAGQDFFLSTSDPDYQTILSWIEAGEYR